MRFADLVKRAEEWKWCSLAVRESQASPQGIVLNPWPIEPPDDWLDWVNLPQTERELSEIRQHLRKGNPFWKASLARARLRAIRNRTQPTSTRAATKANAAEINSSRPYLFPLEFWSCRDIESRGLNSLRRASIQRILMWSLTHSHRNLAVRVTAQAESRGCTAFRAN